MKKQTYFFEIHYLNKETNEKEAGVNPNQFCEMEMRSQFYEDEVSLTTSEHVLLDSIADPFVLLPGTSANWRI